MKRSALHRKVGMRPTARKAKKKQPRAKKPTPKKLRETLWELCKQITRLQQVKPDGTFACYTCNKTITNLMDCHTGHFIPSSVGGLSLRYHLGNLRPQCRLCNVWHGGMGAEFYRKLVAERGQAYVDSLFALKNVTVRGDRQWYEQKIEEYGILLTALRIAG